MQSNEFYLWLNGYLEALESEGIDKIKIKSIRDKMQSVKLINRNQERVIFGPPEVAAQPTKPIQEGTPAPNPRYAEIRQPIPRK
jgi:hypothetical protein